jgi:hypothetical protein
VLTSVAGRVRSRGRFLFALALLIGAVGVATFGLFDVSLLKAVGIVLFLASALLIVATSRVPVRQPGPATEGQPQRASQKRAPSQASSPKSTTPLCHGSHKTPERTRPTSGICRQAKVPRSPKRPTHLRAQRTLTPAASAAALSAQP